MVRVSMAVFFLVFFMNYFDMANADQHTPLLPIEKQGMRGVLQKALEHNEINQSSLWKNGNTDSSIEVFPSRAYSDDENRPCREFKSFITRQGRVEEGFGKACRRESGKWQILTNYVYNNLEYTERPHFQVIASRGFYYSARNPYYMPRGREYRYMTGSYDYYDDRVYSESQYYNNEGRRYYNDKERYIQRGNCRKHCCSQNDCVRGYRSHDRSK